MSTPALTMEDVCARQNARRALHQVLRNRGAPGVDRVRTTDPQLRSEEFLRITVESLKRGTYEPKPVRRVAIPKPGGGSRPLGIPTVGDRVVQQMIAQVLAPVLESVSSESSFAYRRGRGPIDAVKAAVRHGQAGYVYVADLDLVACFDHLPHKLILARLGPLVDGEILDLVQKFLQSGVRVGGEDLLPSTAGTPQGGPLSPLLCNLVLDPMDQALERRGHLFIRYADDVKILLKSKAAAKRVAYWFTDYLWREFGLKVHPLRNDDGSQGKSKVTHITNADLLGFSVLSDWNLSVSGKRIPILKTRIKQRFQDDTEYPSVQRKVVYLNDAVRGWCAYYRDARLPVPLLVDLNEFLLGLIQNSHPRRNAGRMGIPSVRSHVSGLYGRNEEASPPKGLQEFGITGFLETFSRIKGKTVRGSQKQG